MNKYKIITLRAASKLHTDIYPVEYTYPSDLSFADFLKQIKEDQGVLYSECFIPITAIAEIRKAK